MVEFPPEPTDYSDPRRREYFAAVQAQRLRLGRDLAELIQRRKLGEEVDPDLIEDMRSDVWAHEAEALRVDPQADSTDREGPRP
jgi:hypothetical protein